MSDPWSYWRSGCAMWHADEKTAGRVAPQPSEKPRVCPTRNGANWDKSEKFERKGSDSHDLE